MLDVAKLHVKLDNGVRPDGPLIPRRYTLTHSDRTGHLFLTIGNDYDHEALRKPQVRLERDEVLGEWVSDSQGPRLDLHMAAQGGLPVFGTGALRCRIFRHYRPLVMEALRYGDRALTQAHPELDHAPVTAHFRWRRGHVDNESWGRWGST